MQSRHLTTCNNWQHCHLNKGREAQCGSVIIEFILVAPLMLFILGYSLRLTQLLQAHQIAMIISREAATEAFRRCADITILSTTCTTGATETCVDLSQTEAAITGCIGRVRRSITDRWNTVRPSSSSETVTLDVEVYRFGLSRYTTSLNCSVQLNSDDKTRISTDSNLQDPFATASGLASLCRRNRASRARISFPLNPIFIFLNLIPGSVNSAFTINDDTVI